MYQNTIIVGNVGRDAEMRFTPSGVPVTNFSVAVNKTWNNKNGEKQEKTTWFKVVCWNKLAEIAGQYVTKGMKILVEGEVSVSAYADRSGNPAASLELTANNFKFLSSKGEVDTSYDQGRDDEGAAAAGIGSSDDESPF